MPIPLRNLMRAMNRATILDIIRTNAMISRTDIAKSTGLSQASVTGLTADLIREGLILEKQAGEYEGGRRPILLALNPEGAFVAGIKADIGEIHVVIINFEAAVLASHRMPLDPVRRTVEDVADNIVRAVQSCIWEANFSKDRISGVGISIPGLVDSTSGMIRFLPNYGWRHVNLQPLVRERLKHPVYVDNSANTMAIAEQWFGEGRGIDNFLVVTIENGVGMGAVIHGRLYRGGEGMAGEFGHITLEEDGPVCRCGKKGCLEAYAGNNAMVELARKAAEDGLWQPRDISLITYATVVEAARSGVPVLRRIFARAGEMMGRGLAHLITLYNPTKIILTGRGVQAGPMFFDSMYAAIPRYISAKFGRPETGIIIRNWTDDDWARGAGTLVLQELYKSPVSRLASTQ